MNSVGPEPRKSARSEIDDHLHEECGVFGVYGHADAAKLAFYGLYALQHRGQESAGIASGDGETLRAHRGMGLVGEVFAPAHLAELRGHLAIGHNRYSTYGHVNIGNAQPLVVNCRIGTLAVAHNGNLTNAGALRRSMEAEGSIFQSTSDTEVVLHLAARSRGRDVVDMLQDAVQQVQGAGSFLFATRDALVAYRDPHGFRPLAIGRLGEATVFASETCAFDLIDAEYVRDVEPGEMVIVDAAGTRSVRTAAPAARYQCIFEHVYFARPDSKVFGENVDRARRRCGKQLAREHPALADIVISVPDSSNTAAMGFAQVSGLRYEIGLIRNHYVGRTFINPEQGMRSFGVRVKFNPVAGVLRGRRVVLVDDSIVRGTTMTKLVKMVRAAGAVAVHLRIASPPVSWPCFYGIDTPTEEELIAAQLSVPEIRMTIGADSLGYLSLAGMHRAVRAAVGDFCAACYTGDYPLPVTDRAALSEERRRR